MSKSEGGVGTKVEEPGGEDDEGVEEAVEGGGSEGRVEDKGGGVAEAVGHPEELESPATEPGGQSGGWPQRARRRRGAGRAGGSGSGGETAPAAKSKSGT